MTDAERRENWRRIQLKAWEDTPENRKRTAAWYRFWTLREPTQAWLDEQFRWPR